ncbi:MAG: hypothetical protein QXS26_02210 [Thermosphaera sp.]
MKSLSTIVGGYLVLVIMVLMLSQLIYAYNTGVESWRRIHETWIEEVSATVNPPLLSLRLMGEELYLIVKTPQPVVVEAVFKEVSGVRTITKVSMLVRDEASFPLNYTGASFRTGVIVSGGVLVYYVPWRDPWLRDAPAEIIGKTTIDDDLVNYLRKQAGGNTALTLDWLGYKIGLGIVNYTNVGSSFETLVEKGPIQCYQTIPTPYTCTVSLLQNYGWMSYGELPSKPYYSFVTYDGVLADARSIVLSNDVLWLNMTFLSQHLSLQGGQFYAQVFRVARVVRDLQASFQVNVSIANTTVKSRIIVTAYIYEPRVNLMQPVLLDLSSIGSTGPEPWVARIVVDALPQGVVRLDSAFSLTIDLTRYGLEEAIVVYGVELVCTLLSSTTALVYVSGLAETG